VTILIYGSHDHKEMSQRFEVVTVPKIWVNDKIYINGAAPSWEMMAMTFVMMMEQALDESIAKGKFRTQMD
jgi:hypothetical protein